MFDILTECQLFEYFLYETLFGKFMNRKKIFEITRKIFFLPANDELFQMLESNVVKEICSENDYNRFVRIKQYNELLGQEQKFSKKEAALVAMKGSAISVLSQYKLFINKEMSKTQTIKTLMSAVDAGNIIAIRMIGVLQCEGYIVHPDRLSGLKNLNKAARWADISSLLAALRYCEEKDEKCFSQMLETAVDNTPYLSIYDVVKKKYKVESHETSREIALVKKASAANIIRQEYYNPMYARIIYSQVIGANDKEKIVFAENKAAVSDACDLPLHLTFSKIPVKADGITSTCVFKRDKEFRHIIKALQNNDLRNLAGYKPLCLCSESEYVRNTYISIISNMLCGVHVEKIDVADLYERDFEPTKNDVFIRNIHKEKDTIILLLLKGEIDGNVIKYCKQFLNSAKRKKYALNQPLVTIDLSSVLPICICDMENANKLRGSIETIELEAVKQEEKPYIIKQSFCEKVRMYTISCASITDETVKVLSSLEIEKANDIIDKFLCENRGEDKTVVLDVDSIQKYLNKKKTVTHKYGFGGDINENN